MVSMNRLQELSPLTVAKGQNGPRKPKKLAKETSVILEYLVMKEKVKTYIDVLSHFDRMLGEEEERHKRNTQASQAAMMLKTNNKQQQKEKIHSNNISLNGKEKNIKHLTKKRLRG